MTTQPPERHQKQKLSLVPEQQGSVEARIDVILIGSNAKLFGRTTAEVYGTVDNQKDRPSAGDIRELNNGPRNSTNTDRSGVADFEHVIHCPLGADSCARLRFKPVETFNEALPNFKNRQGGPKPVAAFVVWRTAGTWEDELWMFESRMAEIRFVPAQYRPHVAMFGFGVTVQQQEKLEEIVTKWKSLQVVLDLQCFATSDDESVMDMCQWICDCYASRALDATTTHKGGVNFRGKQAGSAVCAVL